MVQTGWMDGHPSTSRVGLAPLYRSLARVATIIIIFFSPFIHPVTPLKLTEKRLSTAIYSIHYTLFLTLQGTYDSGFFGVMSACSSPLYLEVIVDLEMVNLLHLTQRWQPSWLFDVFLPFCVLFLMMACSNVIATIAMV